MKTRTMLIGVLLLGILTPLVCAQYDPQTGRFLQRDPMGVQVGAVVWDQNGGAPRMTGLNGPTLPQPVIKINQNSSTIMRPQIKQNIASNTNPLTRITTPSGIHPAQQYNDGMNLYQYVGSNPTNRVDPYGLEFYDRPRDDCGYGVFCGKIKIDSAGEWIAAKIFRARHCDLRNTGGDSAREDEVKYPVLIDRSETRILEAGPNSGTKCSCASCGEIGKCIQDVDLNSGPYHAVGNNCQTNTARQLSRCCLKTNWQPNWHAEYDPCMEYVTFLHNGEWVTTCGRYAPEFYDQNVK